MPHAKLSAVCAWMLAAGVVFLSACSTTAPDPTAEWSPTKIYAEAKDELSSGAYDKAVVLFEKLEGRAAGTPLAQQAQLDKAYAHYKAGESVLAIATLDRFIKLHPASPALDYALYLKGLVNFQ
jgi:outer membrane protein assembly factor BamD